jgi:hypothetical protein
MWETKVQTQTKSKTKIIILYILIFTLLENALKILIYKTQILPLILYDYETYFEKTAYLTSPWKKTGPWKYLNLRKIL